MWIAVQVVEGYWCECAFMYARRLQRVYCKGVGGIGGAISPTVLASASSHPDLSGVSTMKCGQCQCHHDQTQAQTTICLGTATINQCRKEGQAAEADHHRMGQGLA